MEINQPNSVQNSNPAQSTLQQPGSTTLPVEQISNNVPLQHEHKLNPILKILGASILGIAVLAGVFFAGMFFSKQKQEIALLPTQPVPGQNTANNNSLADLVGEQELSTDSVTLRIGDNKLFYIENNNVYSYDVTTKQIKKWTAFVTTQPSLILKSLSVTETDDLGFVICETTPTCKLYVLDLESEQLSVVKEFSNTEYKYLSDFFDKSTYAYESSNPGKWQLNLVKNGQEKIIDSSDLIIGGRGGFIEDHQAIHFSPAGQYLLYIDTASQRTESVEDINVYIYDVNSGDKKTIPDATTPEWLDNDTIVFRRYSAKDTPNNGLYIYTLSTASEQKIDAIMSNAYFPAVDRRQSQITFTDLNTLEVSTYNLLDKQVVKVLDNAKNTLWLNGETIVYNETTRCTADCGPSEFESTAVKTKNILSGEVGTIPNLIDLFEVATNTH